VSDFQKPRKPDLKLRVSMKDPKDKRANTIGSAWVNKAGYITLKLDPAVVLDWRDEVYITLFPEDDDVKEGLVTLGVKLEAKT